MAIVTCSPHGSRRSIADARALIARIRTAALALGCALALPVWALSPPPPFPAPGVSVSPAVAAPGVPRTLTIAGVWPNSCVPGAASIAPAVPGSNTVVVKLTVPASPAICLAALTPYWSDVSYTPTQAGVQRVLAFTTDDQLIAEGDLVTQGVQKARSLTDLTGVWHDSATAGSGLSLLHSFAGSDTLVGAWFLFDQQGRPGWYAIQHGAWVSPTLFVGQLLAYEAAPGGCGPGQNACPKLATSSRLIGSVQVEVQAPDLLLVEVYGPQILIYPPPPQVPIIRSIVTRLRF